MLDIENEHPLFSLLQERLPLLGLDVETYTPYVLALFPIPASPTIFSMHEVNDSTNSEIEGWDDVVELLLASSDENLSEEDYGIALTQLKNDLIRHWITYQYQQYEQKQSQLAEQEQNFQKLLQQERELAVINEMTSAAAICGGADDNEARTDTDLAKQALLHRFGYEDDDVDDDLNTSGLNSVSRSATSKLAGKDEAVNSTATSSLVKSCKFMSSGISTAPSKREEQQKTKLQQQQKVTAKEERRKRATKGERRR